MKFIYLVLGLFLMGCGAEKNNEQVASTVSANTPVANTTPRVTVSIPQDEHDFMVALIEGAEAYRAAPNELKKSSIRKERDQRLHELLPKNAFKDWYGKLTEMKTTGDGDAYITIEMTDQLLKLKTWNNSLSDIDDRTLIKHGSPMYERIANLEEGQVVKVSGHIIKEGSVTEAGAMIEPEFITKFSNIEPIN